jgi:adenylosuccinate synthase
MVDLKNENILRYKIDKNLEIKNFIIKKYYGGKVFSSKTILKEYLDYGKKLNRFIKNTFEYINGPKRKNILFEGAQGTLLDIDFGTYPFVTGSNAAAGGVCTGTGISPVKIGKIIGVTKAYTTRVGAGSFPTELPEKENKALREKGGEFGVTTGRPRRCGWFDSVMIRYSSMINGFHSMAVTKLDILSGIKEIKLCTGYRYKNSTIKEFPADMQVLSSCKPIYKTMKGWDDDIAKSCTYKELPGNAKKYLDEIKRLTKTDISIVSVGPGREQTILLDKDLWKK